MLVPQLVTEVGDIGLGHGRKTISFGPILQAKTQLVMKFLLGREDFVGQGSFRNDSKVWLEMGVEKRAGKDPVRVRRIECRTLVTGPGFATTCGWARSRPVVNGLFVIAQDVQNCCMFDEDRLEGRSVTWYLVSQHLDVPLSQKLLQRLLKVWSEAPWGP